MKKLTLIIAAVILLGASSCAPSYMCPTYASSDQTIEIPAELDEKDL